MLILYKNKEISSKKVYVNILGAEKTYNFYIIIEELRNTYNFK